MTDNERAMYTGIAISRNTEVNLRWSRSQMFIFINFGGVSFLATQIPSRGLHIVVGVVGIILGVVWMLANWRAQKWVEYWNSRLAAVEGTEPHPVTTPVYRGPEWEKANSQFGFPHMLMALAVIFTLMWFTIVVLGFTRP